MIFLCFFSSYMHKLHTFHADDNRYRTRWIKYNAKVTVTTLLLPYTNLCLGSTTTTTNQFKNCIKALESVDHKNDAFLCKVCDSLEKGE